MSRPSGIAGVGAQSHVDGGQVGTTGNGGGLAPVLYSLLSACPKFLHLKSDQERDADSGMVDNREKVAVVTMNS